MPISAFVILFTHCKFSRFPLLKTNVCEPKFQRSIVRSTPLGPYTQHDNSRSCSNPDQQCPTNCSPQNQKEQKTCTKNCKSGRKCTFFRKERKKYKNHRCAFPSKSRARDFGFLASSEDEQEDVLSDQEQAQREGELRNSIPENPIPEQIPVLCPTHSG